MDEEEKKVEEVNTTSTTTGEKKGFNITALVLGIISAVTFCWWYVSVPAGIVAIIFSIAGKKEAGKGMGTAGMVLGIIGLVLCIIFWVLVILGISALATLE